VSGAWGRSVTGISKWAAINAVIAGRRVVYAMRMPDGAIKIGCTSNLANRSYCLHGEILGFRFGGFDEERVILAHLRPHRVRGYEYFRPDAPEVLEVVNEMREPFGLPPLAA
jgi:hypothetical protein